MMAYEGIFHSITPNIMMTLQNDVNWNEVQEIRLRINQPLQWKQNGHIHTGERIVTKNDLQATIARMSQYSLYAISEEWKQGFLTLAGGHRVGICGKVVVQNGVVQTVQDISSLNIRVAREVIGCAEELIHHVKNVSCVHHTLLISPPACGKTTILRELVRVFANPPYQYTVGVVDERGEISGMYEGVPQLQLGMCSDILYGCPKSSGMLWLLRSMSPQIIAVDELGKQEDFLAVQELIHAGVKVFCTIHGTSLEELQKRPYIQNLLSSGTIERFVLLSNEMGVGTISEILNQYGHVIYKKRGD